MRGSSVCIAGVVLLAGLGVAAAASRLTPSEIQAIFFNGEAFIAATPSGVKYKMTATPDGKITREPLGKAGGKGEGTWKLDKSGFCTTWSGSKPNCFAVLPSGPNKWSVMKGSTVIAVWTK